MNDIGRSVCIGAHYGQITKNYYITLTSVRSIQKMYGDEPENAVKSLKKEVEGEDNGFLTRT
jgi:hypothetical protein